MRGWRALALLALLLAGGWAWLGGRPVPRADGVVAAGVPAQENFDSMQPAIAFKGATLQPLATFALTARVLARDDYRFDPGADLAPTDLVFGWGRMSDSAVVRRIRIRQGGRFSLERA